MQVDEQPKTPYSSKISLLMKFTGVPSKLYSNISSKFCKLGVVFYDKMDEQSGEISMKYKVWTNGLAALLDKQVIVTSSVTQPYTSLLTTVI